MIVGNKTDLAEDDSERAVKSQDGKKLAEVPAQLAAVCKTSCSSSVFSLQAYSVPISEIMSRFPLNFKCSLRTFNSNLSDLDCLTDGVTD